MKIHSTLNHEAIVPPAPSEWERPGEAPGGGSLAPAATAADASLWGRFLPRSISFFKLALLDQLNGRPYHTVRLEGPFLSQQLAQDYAGKVFRSETSLPRSGATAIQRLLFTLGDGVFAYLEEDELQVYAPTAAGAAAAAQPFRRYLQPPAPAPACFYLITLGPEGPSTEPVPVARAAPASTAELALHYGADFPAWEAEWTERMRQAPSGLSILFGPPGCGKTSFLRALMARLRGQAVFYLVPLSEVELLASPRFVHFWMHQTSRHAPQRKLAILEDAEELLLTRDAGSRDRVSNLLNIADGFLGDQLRLHVIATTNTPFSQLDPAILRPGRLIGMREFRRLNRAEAARLAEAKGLALPDQRDFSLAELYCAPAQAARLSQPTRIGFAPPDRGPAAA